MKYADVILPDMFRFEQNTQIGTGGDNAYMITGTPCTTPKFERKTAFEMAQLIADKMGTKDKFDEGKTEEQWIRDLYEQARAKNAALPTFEEAQEKGVSSTTRLTAVRLIRTPPVGSQTAQTRSSKMAGARFRASSAPRCSTMSTWRSSTT